MPYSDLELAEVFIKTGELADALDALNRHLMTTPKDDAARRLRIEILARMPDDPSLNRALQEGNSLSQKTAEDCMLQAVILTRLARDDEAIHVLQQSHKAYPDNERLLEHYLQLLKKQGKVEKARRIVNDWLQINGTSWRWWQWAGDLAVAAGDDAPAVDYYDRALAALQKRYPIQMDKAARPLAGSGMTDAAALTVAGTVARIVLARADACFRLSRLEDAEAGFIQAAVLIPNDPMIFFNRGLIAMRRGDLDGAVGLCKGAMQSASQTWQEHMGEALLSDPVYMPLVARLMNE